MQFYWEILQTFAFYRKNQFIVEINNFIKNLIKKNVILTYISIYDSI